MYIYIQYAPAQSAGPGRKGWVLATGKHQVDYGQVK